MAEFPAFLSAQDVGSFAYLTVKDRLPQILTKAIDTLHRHKSEFFEKHGKEGVEAEKKAISLLSKLRNELQTDKPITRLADKWVDTDIWNHYLGHERSLLNGSDEEPRWFFSPWLFVECYMYRRIHEAIVQRQVYRYWVASASSRCLILNSSAGASEMAQQVRGLLPKERDPHGGRRELAAESSFLA
ncbi:Armt1 [Phodopus roborovskii]|uniref:Sugar phosphate phosphatase n=1 Tax=Phodopus roborovskii TaxID=109678 RepID=A0AAV0A7T2_PHORO|nr:Armt1 [Phodopus roborovskii]